MKTELDQLFDVDAMIRARDAFSHEIEASFARLDQARELFEASGLGKLSDVGLGKPFEALAKARFDSYSARDPDTADRFVKGYDALAWKRAMELSGLRGIMSTTELDAWDKTVEEKSKPAFRRDELAPAFDPLFANRHALIERGVISVFRHLSWSRSTDLPIKLGKKLRVATYSGGIGYDLARHIDDITRFMRLLDGQPAPAEGESIRGFGRPESIGPAGFETPYVVVKGFKNGNPSTSASNGRTWWILCISSSTDVSRPRFLRLNELGGFGRLALSAASAAGPSVVWVFF